MTRLQKNIVEMEKTMVKTEMKDWIALGKQSKLVQVELFKLLSLSNKVRLPKTITKYIVTSTHAIADLKSQAENRMFKEYPDLEDKALKIFYGDDETDL